jgi:Calpain family cysteine protease
VAYANLGTGNSLWAALLEKAFTYVRSGATPATPTYSTIDNGGWMSESFTALGLSNSDYFPSSASQLVSELGRLLSKGDAVTIAIDNPEDDAPLIGDHAYTVDHMSTDSKGNVTIVLRNPWGVDGAGNDGNNDGYVTCTPAQLYASMMGGTAAIV